MSASPCPMPGVSTMTRSLPAALHAAITSASRCGTWPSCRRVASDRKNTTPGAMLFIRIRSPSSAPPARRRLGSMATTATRTLSSLSRRSRRTSSSVRDDLPDPPVPVMPSTGTVRRPAASPTAAASAVVGARLQDRDRAGQRGLVARDQRRQVDRRSRQVDVAVADQLVDHPGQAQPLPVVRAEDAHAARGRDRRSRPARWSRRRHRRRARGRRRARRAAPPGSRSTRRGRPGRTRRPRPARPPAPPRSRPPRRCGRGPGARPPRPGSATGDA